MIALSYIEIIAVKSGKHDSFDFVLKCWKMIKIEFHFKYCIFSIENSKNLEKKIIKIKIKLKKFKF